MDLGYGFTSGTNRISKQKVCYWLHTDNDITWNSFVWYIADYCDIEDFGEDWISIRLVSVKQREFFYKRVIGCFLTTATTSPFLTASKR